MGDTLTVAPVGLRAAQPRTLLGLILRRTGYVGLVVLSVYTLAFFLLYALPSDPIAIMIERRSLGAGATDDDALEILRTRYGFEQPVLVRYVTTLGLFLTGDLGISFQSGRPVAEMIASVAPNTLALGGTALLIALPLSVFVALIASWRSEGAVHRLLTSVPAVLASIPAFWLGLLLIQLFSFQLRWVPSSGGASLLLAALALALPVSASLTAVLIRALDDAGSANWVELLRVRRVPWPRIYLAHIARNASLPFLTLAGLTIAGVLVGTVITETVFSRSGLGRLLVSAIESQDAPIVLATATLAAVLFALVNFAVDVIYPVLDPRLRTQRRTR